MKSQEDLFIFFLLLWLDAALKYVVSNSKYAVCSIVVFIQFMVRMD